MTTPENQLNQQNKGEGGINIGATQGDVEVKVRGDMVGGDKIITTTNITQMFAQASPEQKAALQTQALAAVAEIPADQVPSISHLPAHSRMTLRPNPHFVGREDELLALAQTLKVGGVVALSGMAGVGKTQTAVEFVHRYGQYFAGGVYWLSMSQPQMVGQEVINCGRLMNIFDYDRLNEQDKLAKVQQLWQEPLPRLLVFDNCEDAALLSQWRPVSGGARILITSTRADWSRLDATIETILLDTLPRADSLQLLQKLVRTQAEDTMATEPLLDDAEAEQLADFLGDFPLALHAVGSYIGYWHGEGEPLTAAELQAELEQEGVLKHEALQQLEGTGLIPTQQVQNLYAVFMTGYRQVKEDDLLKQLLHHAACFELGEPFPVDVLLVTLQEGEAELGRAMRRKAKRALDRLSHLGQVQMEEDGLVRLHRLRTGFLVQELGAELTNIRQQVGRQVNGEAVRLIKAETPVQLRPWVSQLIFMAETVQEDDPELAATLFDSVGRYFVIEEAYATARPYYDIALEIRQRVLGERHPDTAMILNNIGEALSFQGLGSEAWPYHKTALEIRRETLGEAHKETARSWINIGTLLEGEGKYDQARQHYEKAVSIWRTASAEPLWETAWGLNCLGILLERVENYAEARQKYEEALSICQQVKGDQHRYTANCLTLVGGTLKAQEKYAEARPYYEEALAIYRQGLGENHPTTAWSLNNLGDLWWAQEEYEAATQIFEQALALELPPSVSSIWERTRSLESLAWLADEWETAQRLMAQVIEINEAVFGVDHPDTEHARQVLADVEAQFS